MSFEPGMIAWEDGEAPFPANFGLTWWECLRSPGWFFSRVSWSGPFSRPLLYFLIVGILAAVLGLFWFVWGPWGAAQEHGLTLELQLLSFFLTPFALLLALGLISLVQHLFVLLLAPQRRGLGATATVLCYSGGIGLASAVLPPAIGLAGPVSGVFRAAYLVLYVMLTLAVQVWYVVVLVIGMRQAHSTTTGRAAAIVLLPMAIGLVLMVVLVMMAVALIALADFPV
ncbi:MAG: YIP1 family protein [Gemmatimonadales bacterium]